MSKKLLIAVSVLLLAIAGGVWGYGQWQLQQRASMLADGQLHLAEGKLREARDLAEQLRIRWPAELDGYILGAWTLRALHDRPATAELLQQAYDLAPADFPMLAELVDHRMRGPDDPQKGYDSLDFLKRHLDTHPADGNIVAQAQLVAYAYLLGQETLTQEQRDLAKIEAEKALSAFKIAGKGTTGQHYDRAQVLLALGQRDSSIAAARSGISAATDQWQSLVMLWALTTLELHVGRDDLAWGDMKALQSSLENWPGTHFGMGKPLVEFLQLTARVRFGKKIEAPADYEARLARLQEEGVRLQYGDDETRDRMRKLLAALDAGDGVVAYRLTEDLLALISRDRGCEMENQVIRPNTEAMLYVVQGDLLVSDGQFENGEKRYWRARSMFPKNAWFDQKISEARAQAAAEAELSAVAPTIVPGLP
jgi:hypothetical protein